MKVSGQRFSVVGAGRSGIAAANVLATRGGDVVLFEARATAPRPANLHPAVAFEAGTNSVRPGDVAVLSPGIKEVSPVRGQIAAAAGEVIGEVELFYRLCPAPILAITGTDGKSTTTTMLGEIAARHQAGVFVGGNLGNPLCEGLDDLTPSSLVVAEISGFQLTTCVSFRPRVAILTNIAEDHVDYHGSMEAYQAAKRRVFREMTAEDVLILNADDPAISAWERPEAPTVLRFSLTDPGADAWYAGRCLWIRVDGEAKPLMKRSDLSLLGRHNVANALAAALAASRWGIPFEAIKGALGAYRPLPHRLATVATVGGVRWVNDSKATNPNAASAGIRAIEDQPLVLLAGGSDKDSDFSALGALIRERTKAAVLFGATRHAIAKAIGEGHPVIVVETLPEAVAAARDLAKPGETVLLSPACASFDQFRSYEHRGEVFAELIGGS